MTPEDNANVLIRKFFEQGDKGLLKSDTYINPECAKQCALICVNDKIKFINELDDYFYEAGHDRETLEKAMEIQLEIKQEIIKQLKS